MGKTCATDLPLGLAAALYSGPVAFQLAVFLGEQTQTFDLPASGEVTIGRGEGSAVRVDDPSVSRQHAVLRLGDRLEIEDLSGSNGIFIREKARSGTGNETLNMRQLVRRKADLAVGERILLGTASMVVRHAPQGEILDLEAAGRATGGVALRDPAMRALYEQAMRAARAPISVLLLGETGVGKEVLARAIHARSPRAKGPFMGINCAALAESLLESELFGSEKGAFTGAVAARPGLFEAASGGTVFLDEVGDLPLAMQGKLLRVLEERVVTRLGSTRARPIDVRFVAATNRDVEADSRTGRFRSDLYFRLAGISLAIPPLRERPAEVDLLVETSSSRPPRRGLRSRALGGVARGARSAPAIPLAGERSRVAERDRPRRRAVRGRHDPAGAPLPFSACHGRSPCHPGRERPSASRSNRRRSRRLTAGARASRIEIKLARARPHRRRRSSTAAGNQSKAAEALGISRRTLVSRLSEFGLPRPRKSS